MSKARDYLNSVEAGQLVKLPSGAEFRMRKANTFWFAAQAGTLPVGTEADLKQATADAGRPSPEIARANSILTRKLVEDHVIEPKIRDNPNYEAGELGFSDLLPEDAVFIVNYLYGLKMDAAGSSIDNFPGK